MKKNELTIIKEIRDRFLFPETLGVGIGDDAAVLNFSKSALLSTDLMIEDVHFDLSYTSFYHLGFKIVSVNVSDIYAMGGDFKGFIFSFGIPETISEQDFKDLFDGIEDALKFYRGFLIGGDISKSEKVVLSGFAVGETDKPVLRKGAQEGDWIYITSLLGLSSAGFYYLRTLSDKDKEAIKFIRDFEKCELFHKDINKILERHLMPRARNPEKFKDIVKAMIDISDGLLIDLYRVCEESGVGAEIYIDKIPVHPVVAKLAEILNIDKMKLILSGGEDYELLVISDKNDKLETTLIPVGKIIKEKGIYLVDPLQGRVSAKPEGWQHF